MNRKSGVYQITNEINGNFYIGSSVNITARWTKWRGDFRKAILPYKCLIWDAVKKYGIENFTFSILEECEPIKQVLENREQHYLDTLNPKYNIAKNAGRAMLGVPAWNKGILISEEEREKLKKQGFQKGLIPWNKGIPLSDNVKQKLSNTLRGREAWNKGMPCSKKQYEQLSKYFFCKGNAAWNAGIPIDPKHQQKMTDAARVANTGKPRSEQTKRKISRSNMGKDMSMLKGIPRTEEVKEKIRAKQKGVSRDYMKGKPNCNSKSGHYGINWREDLQCYYVRIKNKKYGNYRTIEEAIIRRDDILRLQ